MSTFDKNWILIVQNWETNSSLKERQDLTLTYNARNNCSLTRAVAGMDTGFVGPEAYSVLGTFFKKKNTKLGKKVNICLGHVPRALEVSCAIEGPWSLVSISCMVYPLLTSCNLYNCCSQLLPWWMYMFTKLRSSFGMVPYPFALETSQWTRRTSSTVCGFSMVQLGVSEARICGRVKGSCTRAEEAVSSTFNNQCSNRFCVSCCQGNKFWLA